MFTIIGAGAIGGLIGACLTRDGHDVILVDRDVDHVAAIRQRGLLISGISQFMAHPKVMDVAEFIAAPAAAPPRTYLFGTKSQDTQEAIDIVKLKASSVRCAVAVQNGWGIYQLARAFGSAKTLGALITFSAFRQEPGSIVYSGTGSFRVGGLDATLREEATRLAEALQAMHPVSVTDNIVGYLWAKAALGAFYFASALASVDVPLLLTSEDRRALFSALVAEVVNVGSAMGVEFVSIDGFDPSVFSSDPSGRHSTDVCWDRHVAFWSGRRQQRTGAWRDLAIHHRPSEIAEEYAPVVESAARFGIQTPLLDILMHFFREIESGSRELGLENYDEMMRLA